MPFLIDGHNLIAKTPGLRLSDPDDEQALIKLLRQYLVRAGKRGEVIFDRGQPGGPDWSNRDLKVLFASDPATADERILARLAKNKQGRGLVLVSDDQRLVQAAKRAGAGVKACGDFARELRAEPKQADKKEAGPGPGEVEEWLKEFRRAQGPHPSMRSMPPSSRRRGGS